MKLQVPFLQTDADADLDQLSQLLDAYPMQALSNTSWPQFATSCSANFAIVHTGQRLLLKFFVSHDYFKTMDREINEEVHLDNCVEFFISFDGSETYYNIEFNCLGIGKMAYGSPNGERTLMEEAVVRKILTSSTLTRKGEFFNWEMLWSVPVEAFAVPAMESFNGVTAAGNFYNCGDDLPSPHYLSWSKIVSPAPDFHRPDCFGEITFNI